MCYLPTNLGQLGVCAIGADVASIGQIQFGTFGTYVAQVEEDSIELVHLASKLCTPFFECYPEMLNLTLSCVRAHFWICDTLWWSSPFFLSGL